MVGDGIATFTTSFLGSICFCKNKKSASWIGLTCFNRPTTEIVGTVASYFSPVSVFAVILIPENEQWMNNRAILWEELSPSICSMKSEIIS
jgi:hypothetical protein